MYGCHLMFSETSIQLFQLEEKRESMLPKVAARIQGAFRGYRERSNWARRKASAKIAIWYRGSKSRKWVRNLAAAFKDVKQDPKFGKNIQWPPHPKVLTRARELLGKIYLSWAVTCSFCNLTVLNL